MARRGAIVCALIGALLAATPAMAQEVPPAPQAPGGVAVVGGVLGAGSMRVGTDEVGVCGEPGYHAPYNDGLGFLETGKALHWRIEASFFGLPHQGHMILCGLAAVPAQQVPEIGTAGPCDSLAGSGGQGQLEFWRIASPTTGPYAIRDVELASAGSVLVVTGGLTGAAGERDGSLLMLLQRRSQGMCLHKTHEPPTGTSYPQGSVYADVLGAITYRLPGTGVENSACEDRWGQVRRHLRGAGAGIECPVPPEI